MPPKQPTAAQQARAQQRAASQQSARQQRQVKTAASAARSVQRNTGGGHFAQYQAVILAEFIACELLVAVTPVATRRHRTGLSPYVPRDMSKLLAIGLVFFLLELAAVASPGAGRFGAWAGLLLLLVTGLGEAAGIVKDLDIFSGGSQQQQDSSIGGAPEDVQAD